MPKIQVRRGTSQDLASVTPDIGEPYYITDTNSFGVGNGVDLAGKGTFDGQWVWDTAIIAEGANATISDPNPRMLTTYLPDDNNNYEILLTGYGTTGSTSGNQQRIQVQTDLITENVFLWYIVTRSSSAVGGGGSAVVTVGTDRYIQLKGFANNTGTYTLYIRGYRRVGTNS